MEKGKVQQLNLFEMGSGKELLHPILQIPMLAKILKPFFPEIERKPKDYEAILNHISFYLLEQQTVRSKLLEKELSEECYTTLYGLKLQLKKSELQKLSFAVELHKEKFEAFIRNEEID